MLYHTYNGEWIISQYDYTYGNKGFIVGEDVVESLNGYAWDDFIAFGLAFTIFLFLHI